MKQPTRPIFPTAARPGVIVHPDARWGQARRWAARSARAARLLAIETAALSLPRWPYTDAAALAWVYAVVVPCLLAMPTHQAGQPQQAYVQFIVQIIIMIVAIILAVVLAPKPPQPKPASLQDFDVPTAEEGKPYCKIFGEVVVKDPNVLWFGDLSSEPIRKKGGKK